MHLFVAVGRRRFHRVESGCRSNLLRTYLAGVSIDRCCRTNYLLLLVVLLLASAVLEVLRDVKGWCTEVIPASLRLFGSRGRCNCILGHARLNLHDASRRLDIVLDRTIIVARCAICIHGDCRVVQAAAFSVSTGVLSLRLCDNCSVSALTERLLSSNSAISTTALVGDWKCDLVDRLFADASMVLPVVSDCAIGVRPVVLTDSALGVSAN